MAFKDVLKSLRKEKGFTQEQLADEMGLSKSAIVCMKQVIENLTTKH